MPAFPRSARAVTSSMRMPLGRVAEAEARLFHFYVPNNWITQGLSEKGDHGGFRVRRGAHDTAHRSVDPYFHRKGFQRPVREDAVHGHPPCRSDGVA